MGIRQLGDTRDLERERAASLAALQGNLESPREGKLYSSVMQLVCGHRPIYVHRHKLHPRPPSFGQEGPNEVRKIFDAVDLLIRGEVADGRKIFFWEGRTLLGTTISVMIASWTMLVH